MTSQDRKHHPENKVHEMRIVDREGLYDANYVDVIFFKKILDFKISRSKTWPSQFLFKKRMVGLPPSPI